MNTDYFIENNKKRLKKLLFTRRLLFICLNVLRGEMSVVGTRPPTLDEWERYQYRHRARMSIKPGLTGLWQISERKDSLDFDEVVKLDTDYIAGWSVGLDLWIVARTVVVMAKHLSGRRGQPETAVGKHAGR